MITTYYELSYFGFNFDRKSALKKSSPFSFMKGKHYTVNAASWKLFCVPNGTSFFPCKMTVFAFCDLNQ